MTWILSFCNDLFSFNNSTYNLPYVATVINRNQKKGDQIFDIALGKANHILNTQPTGLEEVNDIHSITKWYYSSNHAILKWQYQKKLIIYINSVPNGKYYINLLMFLDKYAYVISIAYLWKIS